MNKLALIRAIIVLTVALLVVSSTYAQCSNCAPQANKGHVPGSPLKFYLSPALSQTEYNAVTNAIDGWNSWFDMYCLPDPYSITYNPGAADICIDEYPYLDPGNPAIFDSSINEIELNPQYRNASSDLMNTVLLHEMGHAIGFGDVAPSCAYQSVMDGSINSQTGPFMSSIGPADGCALSTYNPPPAAPPPPPQPPPPTDPPPDLPPDCSADWTGGCSPIVIDLENGGYRLTGAEAPVLFDIAASGTPSRIGWTAAGSDEAFLCFDRNYNGKIDSGAELFGTATLLKNGQRAPNGFVVLQQFDTNGDGVIDAKDRIWPHLMLWRDFNHDGISQPEELQYITASDVQAIDLDYHWSGRRDSYGNLFKYESKVWLRSKANQKYAKPVYDIFFVPVP